MLNRAKEMQKKIKIQKDNLSIPETDINNSSKENITTVNTNGLNETLKKAKDNHKKSVYG